MSLPKFRPEVLAARTSEWAGPVVLARPVPSRVATWCAVVLVAAIAAFLFLGKYTRQVQVAGEVEPEQGVVELSVDLPQARVARRLVHLGQEVTAGQVLFELDATREGPGGSVSARIEAVLGERAATVKASADLQVKALAQRGAELRQREIVMHAELESRQRQVVLQDQRVDLARRKYAANLRLADEGFLSSAGLAQTEGDLNAQRLQREALVSSVLVARRDLLVLQEELRTVDSHMKQADQESRLSLGQVAQERAEQEAKTRSRIVAPVAGIVTTIDAEPGQQLVLGQRLAAIVPAGSRLQVQLKVPSRAIGFVRPGQQVLMRVDAFPYEKFGHVRGRVLAVDSSPLPQQGNERVFRVKVRIDQDAVRAYGESHPFTPGMTLEADIRHDRRRLIEWILDPLVSAAKMQAV